MQAALFESDIPPNGDSNRVSKPWRVLTSFSAVLLLLGYLILPMVFGNADDLRIDRTATAVVSLLLIGASYASSIVIAFFQRGRKLFLLRSLFMPYLATNLLGLFNVLLNVLARGLLPPSGLCVVGLGLPSAFSLIYALAAYLIYRQYGSSQGHRAEDGTPLLSEEEMQRRQLLRLLQEGDRGSLSSASKDDTYRLEGFIPGLEPMQKTWDQLSRPSRWKSVARE